jgi:hypothetical protein
MMASSVLWFEVLGEDGPRWRRNHATLLVEVEDVTASLSKAELFGGTAVIRGRRAPDLNLEVADRRSR